MPQHPMNMWLGILMLDLNELLIEYYSLPSLLQPSVRTTVIGVVPVSVLDTVHVTVDGLVATVAQVSSEVMEGT